MAKEKAMSAQSSQDLAQQVKKLQEQVKNLQKRAQYITPEIEDLIELYRDTERYAERCWKVTKKHVAGLKAYCEEDFQDAVFESYNNKFGKIVRDMENVIEDDISARLMDNISIHFGCNQEETED